ncbi:MAG: DUF6041 domain-containing protein [Actinomycetota bacterium]|nr:DUF6041 domain-containing protein [Actinomycetota bacterium]
MTKSYDQVRRGASLVDGRLGRRLIGGVFVVAGLGKFSDRIEDLPATLDAAAAANAAGPLSRPTGWLASRPRTVALVVGVPMVATGVAQLSGRSSRLAAATQLGLLAGFSLFLHGSHPAVLPVDAAFAAAIVATHREGGR